MSYLDQLSQLDLQRASGRTLHTEQQIEADRAFLGRAAWILFRRFENLKIPILFGLWHKRLRDFERLWTAVFGPEPTQLTWAMALPITPPDEAA